MKQEKLLCVDGPLKGKWVIPNDIDKHFVTIRKAMPICSVDPVNVSGCEQICYHADTLSVFGKLYTYLSCGPRSIEDAYYLMNGLAERTAPEWVKRKLAEPQKWALKKPPLGPKPDFCFDWEEVEYTLRGPLLELVFEATGSEQAEFKFNTDPKSSVYYIQISSDTDCWQYIRLNKTELKEHLQLYEHHDEDRSIILNYLKPYVEGLFKNESRRS